VLFVHICDAASRSHRRLATLVLAGATRGEIVLERVHVRRHAVDAPEHEAQPEREEQAGKVEAPGAEESVVCGRAEVFNQGLVGKQGGPAGASVANSEQSKGVESENG
jgi:hypothetical protein